MDNTQHKNSEPASYIVQAREIFVREPTNPILKASDMPFPCKAVCNPAACLIDGEVLLLLRVIDDKDRSHLHVARSADGIGNWRIETTPLLSPNDTDAGWYDNWGCEDPRITYLEEIGAYAVSYVGYSRYGAGVCIATTQDFVTAKRRGMAIHPYNKDAVLFPRKIGGRYLMLHRPTAGPLENIWISESDDLLHWGNPRCVLEEADQPGWDSGKVGAGPPPVETEGGWALIFHGVMQVNESWEYRFGMALLDKEDPSKLLKRWPEWVFGPQEPYEMRGDRPGVVFPTGLVEKDNQVFLYYGAADTTVALATAKLEMLHEFRHMLESAT
jgi:beta-1,4-mannooligosaccharide/beta-1,4-mannosyl-N-acetylglucosamine phosphorylase